MLYWYKPADHLPRLVFGFQNVPSFSQALSLLSCPNFQNGALEKWAGATLLLPGFLLKAYNPQVPLCTEAHRCCGKDMVLPLGEGCGTEKSNGWNVGGREAEAGGAQPCPENILRWRASPRPPESCAFPLSVQPGGTQRPHDFSSLVPLPLTSSFLQPPRGF